MSVTPVAPAAGITITGPSATWAITSLESRPHEPQSVACRGRGLRGIQLGVPSGVDKCLVACMRRGVPWVLRDKLPSLAEETD